MYSLGALSSLYEYLLNTRYSERVDSFGVFSIPLIFLFLLGFYRRGLAASIHLSFALSLKLTLTMSFP